MSLLENNDKKSPIQRFLQAIEWAGNKLPNPSILFLVLSLGVVAISGIVASFGVSAIHPGTGKEIEVVSLFSIQGMNRMFTEMIRNFTNFAPLGTVLVSLLGIGVAEASGLISTSLKLLVLKSPRSLLTGVVVFAGVISNTASEIGYVLLIPLSAGIFLAVGKHPIAGLAAAFAGVSGGYSANLLLGTIDPLLAGLTQEAAHLIDPTVRVNAMANFYFFFVSTFLITGIGWWVTEKVVVPKLGIYDGPEKATEISPLTSQEKRGLYYAIGMGVLVGGFLLAGTVPSNGFLRDPITFDLLKSPFMDSIVAYIFMGGALLGAAYGYGAGTFKNNEQIISGMSKSMATMGSYLVLVFFSAQFVAYFNWTNLGAVMAIKGSELLKSTDIGTIPLFVLFILISSSINLLIGSASAKWAIMAPIFVPMFMLLGYSPELTQAAYRIGDSVSNVITPMMSYFALIIALVQRYEPKAGIGTLISTMIPYSFFFFVGWVLLFVLWVIFELPIGPGAELFYSK